MTKMTEKLLKIGNRAIKKAQENNRKKGIPNVYSINGKLYFNYLMAILQPNIIFHRRVL